MADLLDIADVAEDLTAYAHDNQLHIMSKMLTPGVHQSGEAKSRITGVEAYASSYVTNDRVILTEAFVNDVLQPGGQGTFTPKEGTVGFKTRFASVRPIKIDELMTQPKMMSWWKTYYGMVKGGKYNPETYPFEAYITDKLIEKGGSDLRRALWNATENPTGDSSLDLFDGWKKQINELILSGDIPSDNVLVNGALTVDNSIDATEELLEEIPDEYLYHPDMVCVSSGAYMRTYWKAFAKKYTSAPYNGSYEVGKILGTDISMIIEPSLRNYNFPIFTLKGNLAYLYDDESQQTNLQVDYDKRTRSVAYIADFQAGAGVSMPELLWTIK